MYDILKMTAENTAKEVFSENEIYVTLYSEPDIILQAKYINHLRRIAKALGVKDDFDTMKRAFAKVVKDLGGSDGEDHITEFNSDYPELSCGKWIADEHGVREIDKNGDIKVASYEPITIVKKTKCIQTGDELVTLAYRNGSTWQEETVSREIICDSRKLLSLTKHGVRVINSNASQLVSYLADIEHLNKNTIQVEKSTAKMGWLNNEFLPYSENYAFGAEDSGLRKLYDAVKPTGSEAKWFEHVTALRAGSRDEIKVMLSASLASVLVERLNVLSFFVNLYGESGNGKSVAMKLATSVWADPGANRYIGDFESTDVALEAKADFLNSLPVMLDDTSKLSYEYSKKFESVVYLLASGKGRSRSNISIGLERERSWKNCTLTTGERPQSSYCKQGGAEARTLEIECGKNLFTNPEVTIDVIEKNYGFAGKRFVEIIKDMDQDELHSIYKNALQEIRKAVPGIMGKQCSSLAVLLTADRIATEQMFKDGQYISMETVKAMAKTEEQVSDYEKIYYNLVDYIRMNKGKFDGGSGEQYGFAKDSEMTYFYILGFDKACEALGYRKPKDFIAWGIRQGLIITDPNRQNKNVKLPQDVAERYSADNGKTVKQVRCICFKMERPVAEESTSATAEIEATDDKTQTSLVNRMTQRTKVFTNIDDLEKLDIPA